MSAYHTRPQMDMDVDYVTSVQDLLDQEADDDEIQVLACYYENTPFPQLVAGRAMTTDLTQGFNDLILPADSILDTIDIFTEPSDELIN